MKYTYLVLFAMLVQTSFAQSNWKSDFKNDRLEIQHSYTECHDEANGIHQEKVLFRFVNLTNSEIEVSFNQELDYGNKSKVQRDQKNYVLKLQAGEQLAGTCNDKFGALVVFSKQLNLTGRSLKRFDLSNIIIKNVE